MNNRLDFTQDIKVDLIVNRNRNLEKVLHCVYIEDGIEMDFNFEDYDIAMMHVKKRFEDEKAVLVLSTINNTIQLFAEGRIQFIADNTTMNVRPGEYVYDLYLYNDVVPKRQFMSGNFIVQETVTN